jgi:hypothetical protein
VPAKRLRHRAAAIASYVQSQLVAKDSNQYELSRFGPANEFRWADASLGQPPEPNTTSRVRRDRETSASIAGQAVGRPTERAPVGAAESANSHHVACRRVALDRGMASTAAHLSRNLRRRSPIPPPGDGPSRCARRRADGNPLRATSTGDTKRIPTITRFSRPFDGRRTTYWCR